jgi:hypothetical protein
MKKLLFLLFIAAVAFGCKRKQDLVEPEGTLAKHPAHCYNGSLDGNELGIDCGGDCDPCNIAVPTCTPAANTLKIGTSSYATTGSSCSSASSEYDMMGTYIGGSYTVKIGNSTPDQSVAYTIAYGSFPTSSTEATVNVSDGSRGSLTLTTGTLYVSQSGGVYVATICGGSAYSFVTGLTYTIEGNVTCP